MILVQARDLNRLKAILMWLMTEQIALPCKEKRKAELWIYLELQVGSTND